MHDLNSFLQSVERRAFRMAQLATQREADALDIVQEAMMKLACRYADKPSEEWRPLFYRILENTIMDWHRKETIKKALFFWRKERNEAERDTTPSPQISHTDPADELWTHQMGQHLLASIEALPVKQQQCFVLRNWEGMSVRETAEIMGIKETSVKSHYFRAIEKLRTQHRALDNNAQKDSGERLGTPTSGTSLNEGEPSALGEPRP